ncbi:MAG: metal-dependent transcriptional regulator [Nitrospirae bacterium]|nr:metal-dependent transcriptional regulator [Nitrospirota bacterium]
MLSELRVDILIGGIYTFMKRNIEIDEYLEHMWYMEEEGKNSLASLKDEIGEKFSMEILDMMIADDLVKLEDMETAISLTDKGEQLGSRIIRAHRLAERLLYNVMGMSKNIEEGACEFEHMVTPELIDSICIMLGHPKECPHGLPIPPGECCTSSATTIESAVVHLTDMKIGESARIAYVNCRHDQQLHRLNGLQIRPGVTVKLHQRYPSYVVECEGSNIALDEEIANNICVWWERKPPDVKQETVEVKKRGIFGTGIFKRCKKDS